MIPEDLLYTADHEWVRVEGRTARVGITDFAQSALGDVVFVQPPGVGDALAAGVACGEIESTKSVSDIYAPITGTVTARNEALDSSPELVNSSPYGDGWLIEVALADGATLDALLTPSAYTELTTRG